MRKRSFETPLVGAGIGAVAGALLGGDAAYAINGAGIGSLGGYAADMIARFFRGRRFRKKLAEASNANAAQLKRLIRKSNDARVPVYIQDGGAPVDNAFYMDSPFPVEAMFPGVRWKDALTGKRVDSPSSKSVLIGKDFRKLPIVAHELGHASDLSRNKWAGKAELALSGARLLALGAMIAGATVAESPALSVAGGLGSIAANTLSSMLSKRNERAASDRAMQSLKSLQTQRKLNDSLELLLSAYKTYDPMSVSEPDFGSNKYAEA